MTDPVRMLLDGGRARTTQKTENVLNALVAAMRSPSNQIYLTILDEPDSYSVRVEHDGQEKVLHTSGVIRAEIQKCLLRKQKLKGATMRIRYRAGSPRPEIDIRLADGGLL